MNRPQDRIPEEQTQEVFTLAAQLYAKHNQSYSVKELMEAGAEAKIPPEFIQQAVDQLQLQKSSTQQLAQRKRAYLIGAALGVPMLAAIALAGWLLTRNAATAQVEQAPIETVNPIPDQFPVSDTNLGKDNFKCANLTFEDQDLRDENLRGADCTRAKLAGANLSGVNIQGANLSHADLQEADLSGANLREADLAGADLVGADLSGANLEGANLNNADLRNANLEGATLDGADLAGAQTEGAKK